MAGFCIKCGVRGHIRIPEGDNRERLLCNACGFIHYDNPRNVVGCILDWQQQVLLCLRGIEPRKGYWTLPAGYLENGESLAEGAARECSEEAHAAVDNITLYSIYSLPQINQVYVMFRGQLRGGNYKAGEETLQASLYSEADVPWDRLAFPIVGETLRHFFADRQSGVFPVRNAEIVRDANGVHTIRHS